MNILIYIGALREGDYEGNHYSYIPVVFADEKGNPFIEKIKNKDIVSKMLVNHIGEHFDIYYDKYGKISLLVPSGKDGKNAR